MAGWSIVVAGDELSEDVILSLAVRLEGGWVELQLRADEVPW
jgi:hypothetical protein